MNSSLLIQENCDVIHDKMKKKTIFTKEALTAWIGWMGTLFALVGGWLISTNTEVSGAAWALSSTASLILVVWSVRAKAGSQIALHGAYLLININGVINYLL